MPLSHLLLVLGVAADPVAPEPSDEGLIPVLIVSGANNHDCEWSTPNMKRILEASGKFDVAVTTDPARELADPAILAKARLFVLDYNGPRWGEAAERGFLAAVSAGAGVAVIHAANNAFPGFVEYEKLVGHLWRDGTGHGKFHEFDLKILDRDHPITRGLGEIRRHPDELYHGLQNPQNATHSILAVAHSSIESGGSGKDEPMITAGSYGRGRVFHTPLGHVWRKVEDTRRSQDDPQFHRLLVRGCEWAATGDVADSWIDLFNGKDLAGWTFHLVDPNLGLGDVWSVVDGAIVCKGRPAGYLRTTEKYENFILELDWRWDPADEGGRNSGVLVRMHGDDKVWPKSFEAQLMSGEAGDIWIIDGFPATRAADRTNGNNTKKTHGNEKPIGEWNRYRITIDRGTAVLEVNGQILNEASDLLSIPGHVCLQSEGAAIQFKNVRLLPLR
jgi:type 1 glutamine amidotransferase